MKSQSSGTSGTLGSQKSPNSLSYQITSSYYYSNPTSQNTIESKELENMLDYALESKRVAPKISTTSKREQTEDLKRRQKLREIEQSKAQHGKGKGHRKKKNLKQIDMLEKVYRVKQKWTRDDLTKLASCTGLTRAQIYKWNWDMRKKEKLEEGERSIHHKGISVIRATPPPPPQKVLPLPISPLPLHGRSKTPVKPRIVKESHRLSVRRASAVPSFTKTHLQGGGIPRFPSIASPPPMPLNYDPFTNRNLTQTPTRLPTLTPKMKNPPNIAPYLQSPLLVTPPPRRPSSTVRSSKRKFRVQKLSNRLDRIHLDSPVIDSGPTTVSHKSPEMTPHFNHSFEFGCGDTNFESALVFSSEKKKKKRAEQPPPSTPILEINEEVRQKVGSLLQQRTCSQAHLYDDDNLSVPEIIFERSKLEEEDGADHLESFLNERQRSNSLGRLTSEQTKNYLDEFLLQNQSTPFSKIGSQLLPPNQWEENKSKKDQESLGSSLKPLRTQFMPGGYFRFESTSSGNTISRRQVKTNRTPGLISIPGRMSSDSSWKNVGGSGLGGGIGGGSHEMQRMVTVSSGSQNQEAPLPHELSAQARILESRRYLLQDKQK